MLDVMTTCWEHEPENRPSVAQVRTIASTPQFCHLRDAVTMETESTVLSATSVFVESSKHQKSGEFYFIICTLPYSMYLSFLVKSWIKVKDTY